MNRRQLTKYAIYIVAALSAALINGFVITYVQQHIDENGYMLVLIDMLIVVLIFAPIFALVTKYAKKLSKVYINTSRKVSGNKKTVLLALLTALVILFILYAKYRHNINVIQDIKNLIA
ncbi:hypothetical protein [Aquimarina brevivitae]|uniref:Uncharacterized protein n=1 Tax=Aquimarina brevivitae TaxID=323412 RepID=A0A4Q7NZI3_9FLAO|nr:hypothetical protein [Aquimarina brevivitae]RZS92470.1 hypothetical protein EV197_2608 [Aquimarina brevivitae]